MSRFVPRSEQLDEITRQVTAKLVDEGKLIEAGWISFCHFVIPKDAPPIQIEEMRNAFFAGAQHLFGSINSIMDADEEPTERDLMRMSQINDELHRFIADFELRVLKPRGHA